jgi:hypothetical protein
MSQSSSKPLIDVLQEARAQLARRASDLVWSSWRRPDDAVRALDVAIAMLERDRVPPRGHLEVLFAPTGPIEQVSLSAGWGREFSDLAARFDAAMERVYPAPTAT